MARHVEYQCICGQKLAFDSYLFQPNSAADLPLCLDCQQKRHDERRRIERFTLAFPRWAAWPITAAVPLTGEML